MHHGARAARPMSHVALFAAAQLLALALGLPLVLCQRWRATLGWAWPAISYLTGSVVLTVAGILLSSLGVRWSFVSLLAVGVLVGVVAGCTFRRPEHVTADRRLDIPGSALLVMAGVAASSFLTTATTYGNSSDFALFWGTKAQLFASSGGLNFPALASRCFSYAHSTYPPLWPTVMAIGAMASGRFPWRSAPLLTPLWLFTAVPPVFMLLRSRLTRRAAGAATTFWYLALAASLIFSHSGGNAEVALVVFETLAVLALMAWGVEGQHPMISLASVCLAGAVLTKLEGAVGVALILGGFGLARVLEGRPRDAARAVFRIGLPAMIAWSLWLVVRVGHGLPVSDPTREHLLHMSFARIGAIVPAFLRNLQAGSLGVAWLVPLAFVLIFRTGSWRRALPALTLCVGLPAFSFVYYLHVQGNVQRMIGWTLPRLVQPALSVWILAVALMVSSSPDRDCGEAGGEGTSDMPAKADRVGSVIRDDS